MITPKSRKEFENHLNLIVKDAESIIKTTYDVRTLKSFMKAKYLPNGRFNFLTIDQTIRLKANLTKTMSSDSFYYANSQPAKSDKND